MRQDVLKFRQHDEGLCGLYTIVNALSALYPEQMTHVKGAVLVSRLAEAVPGDMRSVIQEGTDRAQMDVMLAAARCIRRTASTRTRSGMRSRPSSSASGRRRSAAGAPPRPCRRCTRRKAR